MHEIENAVFASGHWRFAVYRGFRDTTSLAIQLAFRSGYYFGPDHALEGWAFVFVKGEVTYVEFTDLLRH